MTISATIKRTMLNRKPKLFWPRSASAIEELIAKRRMTTTSMVTVTPSTKRVKGPRALSSLMTAMADEGERATKIAAAIRAMARRAGGGSVAMKGIASASRKTARADSV